VLEGIFSNLVPKLSMINRRRLIRKEWGGTCFSHLLAFTKRVVEIDSGSLRKSGGGYKNELTLSRSGVIPALLLFLTKL
jgi:hypothetical protein